MTFFRKNWRRNTEKTTKGLWKEGKIIEVEEDYIQDGRKLIVKTVKTPVRDDKGNIIGILGSFWDITERQKVEEDRNRLIEVLKEKNTELENSSRRLKVTTAQLVQSEKMAALGELTAGVAHELNQPLNGIKIICQSILRDIQKDRFEEKVLEQDLNEVVDQVNKMADIIDHMRVYTRRTGGISKERFTVNHIIESSFKFFGQQFRDRNIEVVKKIDPALPELTGDPIRLEQVVVNLLSNARNAVENSGKETKQIEIKACKIKDANHYVALEVIDNGPGIPEGFRGKIFQPFFTTKEPGKGTGLGLSVAHKIIEEHNGKIEVESRVGDGTIFRILLPIGNASNYA